MGLMYGEKTREKARAILDGMETIVRRERLVRGQYVSHDVDENLKNSGALCKGHKACAVGSLFLAGGIEPVVDYWGEDPEDFSIDLPGTDETQRADFLRPRHALRAAYDALNAAAQETIDRRRLQSKLNPSFTAPIEALFESKELRVNRRTMLGIIGRAKEIV